MTRSRMVTQLRQYRTIIQMSGSYWPQLVARELQRIFGFEHELVNAEQNQIGSLIDRALREAPLESFVGL